LTACCCAGILLCQIPELQPIEKLMMKITTKSD